MKFSLIFKTLFIAGFSTFALARDDCDEIRDYLRAKGSHYDEGNGEEPYLSLIDGCGFTGYGEVTNLEMYTYCLSEKDVNTIINYPTIKHLTLDSNTGYHSIGIESLRSCGESDFYPSGISKLTKLETLDLFGIGAYKKGDIASLPKSVKKLTLSHRNVPQFVINEIGQLSNIEDLTLFDTNDTKIAKLNLSPLANVKKLTISHNDRSSVHKKDYLDASMFKKLSKLPSLTLEYYVINKKGFDSLIKYLPNLKELVFDHCAFDEDVNLDSIKKLTKLTALEFDGVYEYCDETYTVFGDSCPPANIPKSVYSMTNLKKLNVNGQKNPNVELVGNLKNLEYLELQDTELKEIPSGVYALKNLKYLGLRGNDIKKVSDEISNLKNLEGLNVEVNDNLTYVPKSVCQFGPKFKYNHSNKKIRNICEGKTTTKAKTTTKSKTTTKAKTTKSKTTTKTTKTTNKKVPTSTVDGKCGEGYGACKSGYCCSKWGYCGQTSAYCGTGCQTGFGKCN